MAKIKVQGVEMSAAAAECVQETGTNVQIDVEYLKEGKISQAELLEACLDGADDADREQGWREYVDAVCAHAEAAQDEPIGDSQGRGFYGDDYAETSA